MSSDIISNLRLPGETVKIPSSGLLYDDGVFAEGVKDGEVVVYPMSAFDELRMKNISDIINGTAITQVFRRCIPQILQPDELFEKDVNYLLMVLKKITYGNTVTIVYTHTCDKAKPHKYEIPLTPLISHTKYIDATTLSESYTIAMDNGQVVLLQPVKYKDILNIMRDTADYDAMSILELKEKILESTMKIIKSVDGNTNPKDIEDWCRAIPAPWFEQITNALSTSGEWGTQNSYEIECQDCKSETNIELPLNPLNFFLD
jgi:hypothetical protein